LPKAIPTAADIPEKGEKMEEFKCTVCGYVYDPEKGDPDNDIPPGTAIRDLPADWTCPVCGTGKLKFELTRTKRPS